MPKSEATAAPLPAAFLRNLDERAIAHAPVDPANVGDFRRAPAGVARARTRDDVAVLIEAANRHGVALQPFSRGFNWGYGSHLPAARDGDGTRPLALVDLSALDRIVHLDADQGVATIEPGVTQARLAETVARECPGFMLDVTGSGPGTSVIGNALERGIAYQGLRASQLVALEVRLGNGAILRTGFGHYERGAELARLYPYGLGPSLDGLFFQSSLGIVTEATIQLLPRPASIFTVGVSVVEARLPELIDRLRDLRRAGLLQGIPHVADRERMVSTAAPLLRPERPLAEARQAVERALPGDWTLTAAVHGDARVARAKLASVRRALRGLGRVFVHSETDAGPGAWLRDRVIERLATPDQRALIAAAAPLRGLHYGRSTDAGIAFLTARGASAVDANPEGFLLCTPLAPLRGEHGATMRDLARAAGRAHETRLGMTLNLISDRVLEAVISAHFPRGDSVAANRAHACVAELNRTFADRGFMPYRIGIDSMPEFVREGDEHWRTVRTVRQALDPNGVIAPGRYTL